MSAPGFREPLFRVIDPKTGEEADAQAVAFVEEWAKTLTYHDLDGWAIQDDGTLVLLDSCGNWACPPAGRFRFVLAGTVFQWVDDGTASAEVRG